MRNIECNRSIDLHSLTMALHPDEVITYCLKAIASQVGEELVLSPEYVECFEMRHGYRRDYSFRACVLRPDEYESLINERDQLRQELAELREERDILKEANGDLAEAVHESRVQLEEEKDRHNATADRSMHWAGLVDQLRMEFNHKQQLVDYWYHQCRVLNERLSDIQDIIDS